MINFLPPPQQNSLVSKPPGLALPLRREAAGYQPPPVHNWVEPDSLSNMVAQFGSFPPFSVILGQCMDGLPLMIDLSNPKPGSMLLFNMHDRAVSGLVSTICTSAGEINSPEDVVVCMITVDPDDHLGLLSYPHCQAILAPYERSVGAMVYELAAIAEQRRYGRENGPAVLLVIDDLFTFFSHNTDYGLFVNFKWLVNYGPRSMVWPVITIRNTNLSKFTSEMISLFPYRITSSRNIRPLLGSGNHQPAKLRNPERQLFEANSKSSRIDFYPMKV